MILSATVSSAVKFTNCLIAGTLFPCCLHNVVAYSVAEWLVCWTQVLKGLGSDCSCNAVGNSLRRTVYTHCASVYQAAKLVTALLRVARVTAVLVESNGSLLLGL